MTIESKANQLSQFKYICKELLISAQNAGLRVSKSKSKKLYLFEGEDKTITLTVLNNGEREQLYEVSAFQNKNRKLNSRTPYFSVKNKDGRWLNVADYNSQYFEKMRKNFDGELGNSKVTMYDFC